VEPAVFADLRARLPAASAAGVSHGVLVLELDRDQVVPTMRSLKADFGFDMLLDVTAVDWLPKSPRFEVVWHVYSTAHGVRVRVKTRVDEADAAVDTLVPLYNAARYPERECHDMYGIRFRGNGDLRALLLYEGFVGHPLRKDYPKDGEQPLIPMRDPARPA
jgi:NADH-quinone oxidoreductase subunit C